jgi:adenine-specific DNA-methyltransferase
MLDSLIAGPRPGRQDILPRTKRVALLSELERTRLRLSKETSRQRKSSLGQFFTPGSTAAFMAQLFPAAGGECRLLDPGAGIGSLTAAFLARWHAGGFGFDRVSVDAIELDSTLHGSLAATIAGHERSGLSVRISSDDFIHSAVETIARDLFSGSPPRYTHVILNPPYKKMASDSAHRLALRRVGIETVNLYSAFLALAVELTEHGGQIVAIVPRSFCNGPYYRPFREYLLERVAIRHIHLFDSRSAAFRDDAVLQENVILHLERGGTQGAVTISTSTDDSFTDLAACEHISSDIVGDGDPERIIHVPTESAQGSLSVIPGVRYTLDELGIKVSTGPVVDFRFKEHLRAMPEPGTVPLLYPAHFDSTMVNWPLEGIRKPSAILHNQTTERWLYPSGYYCVVRRFSSKEEARRIVPGVVDPTLFGDATMLGFENHLNVFHQNRGGLPEQLARGLYIFLHTTAVDEAFRRFNGHTQVNVKDLTLLRYPSREGLERLGAWAKGRTELTQEQVDDSLAMLK